MKLKGDLANQYQTWQEKIESRNVNSNDIFNANITRICLCGKTRAYRDSLEKAIFKTGDKKVKQELTILIEELDQFLDQLSENFHNFVDSVSNIIYKQGLTPQRIKQFERFTADDSFVGDQCVICMGDIEIGKNMMRLDCDGQHSFCQVCIERWFAAKKTCPICRHVFQ